MFESPDDVDLAFERAGDLAPPDDFLARVLSTARADELPAAAVRQDRQLVTSACLFLLALLALSVFAYQFGLAAGHNGVDVLLGSLVRNVDLLRDAPGVYAGALLVSIPWLNLLAVAFDLAILLLAARLLRVSASAAGAMQAGASELGEA